MTKLATMGTSSCATIAIQGFGNRDKGANEAYITGGAHIFEDEGISVGEFYDEILYPTEQDLGRTRDYPFEELMELIESVEGDCGGSMEDKYTVATLNAYQFNADDKYWPEQFKRWGFELVDKTKNSIGSICYIYVRNKARVDIKDSDYIKE